MNVLPKARNKNIIMQNLENEVLIYDTINDKAYCLNATSAKVFNACDGAASFETLQKKYDFSNDLIYLALDELKKKNLLDEAAEYQSPFAEMNRREVIRKVGLASMIALPVIYGLVAPQSANAASGGTVARGQTCTGTPQCVAGNACRITNTGTQRCCASTNTTQPQEPGVNLGNTSNNICTNTIGPQYCCSGTATNNPVGQPSGCYCN